MAVAFRSENTLKSVCGEPTLGQEGQHKLTINMSDTKTEEAGVAG